MTIRTLVSHEWVESVGGSENVFREFLRALPQADALALWNDMPQSFDRTVGETWLARSPLRGRKALSLPFMTSAWRRIDLAGYDRVVASSHAFGHQLAYFAALRGLEAFSYVHTPARYVWAPEVDPRGAGLSVRTASRPLRKWDAAHTSSRVRYAANSYFLRDRIERSWKQPSSVIYPPVDVERIRSVQRWADHLTDQSAATFEAVTKEPFLFTASRLVSYKRVDVAIRIAADLGLPVVIAGGGPELEDLTKLADEIGAVAHFVGRVGDEFLYALYQEAMLFVFLAIEDFGIMPVEAMAAGTPVLVNSIGGAAESAELLRGGLTVRAEAPAEELREVARAACALSMDGLPAKAEANFSRQVFADRIREWLDEA
ncbi:MAG: glycosyltransferase [Nocardioides sp.]|uniref:glycosyltransferase n=1 Tax=Nocardioides sp. TaxID=35761 RepID=UPI0039E4799E